tara:strand:+ start:13147 stop:13461 length:315 start_codon:yes stop_codon:yes gene_type:complete
MEPFASLYNLGIEPAIELCNLGILGLRQIPEFINESIGSFKYAGVFRATGITRFLSQTSHFLLKQYDFKIIRNNQYKLPKIGIRGLKDISKINIEKLEDSISQT